MSAQQYGPQRHWDHDLQTSDNTPILCSAGIRVKMRASISGFSPSHIAFSFSAAPSSSSFFFFFFSLKHILLGLMVMVMVPFCLLHATTTSLSMILEPEWSGIRCCLVCNHLCTRIYYLSPCVPHAWDHPYHTQI